MHRINQIFENFASAAWKPASLATVFFCLTLGAGKLLAQQPAQTDLLLIPTALIGPVNDNDKTVTRARNVLVNLQLLQNPAITTVLVPLFDEDQVFLVRDSVSPTGKGAFVWHGHGTQEPGTSATFSVVNGVLIGNLTTARGGVYQVRYTGRSVHSLREIDPSRFPPDGNSPLRLPTLPNPLAVTCSTDPPADIDAMVVYTTASRAAAGGQDAMEATIYLAIEDANTAYVNSNITQRLRLVHMEEVSYTESGFLIDVNRLQNPTDGFLDNVPILRDTYAADVVGMIVEENQACGLAYDILDPFSQGNAFESHAYATINRGCAAGNLSLAHEFGHLMGARHDTFVDPTTTPFTWAHGYVHTASPAWRTVMAYPTACGSCPRLPYFSNPNVNYLGSPTGIPATADNHRVLNTTALTVANFRCSSPAASTVWMKDTWDDTGVEPDNGKDQEMWKSPYIWIRNSQDTDLTHQHEHQNPIYGQANWVYVKVHNGKATAASGNLELYWAHASTGLSWGVTAALNGDHGDWKFLTSIPVNSGFPAHTTKIVEYNWATLPGTGHYCLIARWVSSADPLTFAETSDINYNVFANNKIIWRNLNIVDMGHDQSITATFIVRNHEVHGGTTLLIRPPITDLQTSFFRYGVVTVEFDATLMRAWEQTGAHGTGFQKEGERMIVSDPAGAVFQDILLPPEAAGVVKLTFIKLPTTPKRVYFIDAVQLLFNSRTIGGVSYQVTTEIQSATPCPDCPSN